MNVSDGQFGGDSSWSRPQEISNPFNTARGWNQDRGVQTGEAHPIYEGVDDPPAWKEGADTALGRMTVWRTPGGASHTGPPPHSGATVGSTLMGGVGGGMKEIPQVQSPWRSTSFNNGEG